MATSRKSTKPRRIRLAAAPNPTVVFVENPEQVYQSLLTVASGASRLQELLRAVTTELYECLKAVEDAVAKAGVTLYGPRGLLEAPVLKARQTVLLSLMATLDERLDRLEADATAIRNGIGAKLQPGQQG
jgi:hypothetical protein